MVASRVCCRAGRASSGREQPEAVLEAVQDLHRREGAQPHRGELDRQRDAVEPPAQLHHGVAVAVRELEVGRHGGGAVEEERDGVVVRGVAGPDLGGWCRQGRHDEDLLALDPERVPAGGQDAQAGCGGEQLAGQHRAGVGEVLAVVEHHQQPLVLQVGGEVAGGVRGDLAELEGVGHGVGEQLLVVESGQLHEPDAVGEGAPHLGCHPQGQARLADPTDAGQGEHPAARQELPGLRQLAPAAHEAGQLGGQRAATRRRRLRGRHLGFRLCCPARDSHRITEHLGPDAPVYDRPQPRPDSAVS